LSVFNGDTGAEAGHIIYDALGSVVEITPGLPESLAGHLDPSGLQFDGQRYYDPWAGLYTQPNPFGGVPDVPQSLNGFSAASGSVAAYGMAQSGGGGLPPLGVDVGKSTLSNTASTLITEKMLSPALAGLVNRSSWHWLNIGVDSGSRRGIRAPLKRLLGETGGSVSIARRLSTGRLDEWSGIVRLGNDYPEWAGRLGRRGVSLEARSIAREVWNFGPQFLKVADIVPGLGADLIVGGVLQLGIDLLIHPELLFDDPGLLGRRTAAGSLSNATIGTTGMGIAGIAALGLTAAGVSVSAPAILVGGVIVTVTIEVFTPYGQQVEDWWFDKLDAHGPWERR
jgi:hypothetical protein